MKLHVSGKLCYEGSQKQWVAYYTFLIPVLDCIRVINLLSTTDFTHEEEATNIVWKGLATIAFYAIKNSVCSWQKAEYVKIYDTP
jgi:hypothetical protein